jgi:hypothetical protein
MKDGCGKHHMKSKDGQAVIVRPGDVIDCERQDLGGAIDKFLQLDDDPPVVPSKDGLTIVPIGDGTFNVVNPGSGNPINDAPLAANEAADLAGVSIDTFSEPTIAGNFVEAVQVEPNADQG